MVSSYATKNRIGDTSLESRLLEAVTGYALTEEELDKIGERIWNLTRLFNVREGISSKNDTLPTRFFQEEMPEGDAKGQTIKPYILERAKAEYYKLRGWDDNGIPTKEKITTLGL